MGMVSVWWIPIAGLCGYIVGIALEKTLSVFSFEQGYKLGKRHGKEIAEFEQAVRQGGEEA